MHDAPFSDLERLALRLRETARGRFQRRLLVLSGTAEWSRAAADALLRVLGCRHVCWFSEHPRDNPPNMGFCRAGQMLGRESELLVFDAHCGFDSDAFGAAVGTLRGGGLMLLLTPAWQDWPLSDDPQTARIRAAPLAAGHPGDRFLGRLVRVIEGSPASALVQQNTALPEITHESSPPTPPDDRPNPDSECRTADQLSAVEAVVRVVRGHRRRPALLVSDRGRGKSAALGIAAARLLHADLRRIILTGPRLASVRPVFEHAARQLPAALSSRNRLRLGDAELAFFPPDALTQSHHPADLLLVDEAAAIPFPLLERLLDSYSRVAFATTVHGYEGTGRGFAVRFRRHLNVTAPGWHEVELREPIRWARHDPLEQLSFQALMLDAEPAGADTLASFQPARVEFSQLDRDALARDDRTLAQVFGLLVSAHYQTSPLDLRHLLDGPEVSVYALRHGGDIVATVLATHEGGFDDDMAQQVFLGERRLRGHLLPQSLSQHLGLRDAVKARYLRIMRIAVHPALRRRGLGKQLLSAIRDSLSATPVDIIGASFAADAQLLGFWDRAGYRPVRLGVSRDAASGAHSATLLRPLSATGSRLTDRAAQRFAVHFPHMLADPLRNLSPLLAARLLLGDAAPPPRFDADDHGDLQAYAHARRRYEVSPAPLWRLACHALGDAEAQRLLQPLGTGLLIARVLQRRDWKSVADLAGLSGRKSADRQLRDAITRVLPRYLPHTDRSPPASAD